MKEPAKYSLPEQTLRLIDSGRYKDCFTLLRRRLTETPVAGLPASLSNAESTYRYMLQYFLQGGLDPHRPAVLAGIKADLLDIADKIEKENLTADSSDLYFSTLRMRRLRPKGVRESMAAIIEKTAMADLAISAGEYPAPLLAEIDAEETILFDTIWTADNISEEDYKALGEAISNGVLPFSSSAGCIAAAGLGLMRYFNRNALSMLCKAAMSSDLKTSARAVATLLLVLGHKTDRVAADKQACDMLRSLIDIDGMPGHLRSAVIAIIRTRDTDRISKKMQRDVIPGLMQFGPDILKRLKETSEESSFADLEGNPEWERLLKDSGLEEHLRELTELQSDGADVMMVAFSSLKGFPFFRQLRNWMLPFSLRHPMLNNLHDFNSDTLSAIIEANGMMCDSDRYSLAFSLSTMPAQQREIMLGQMNAQAEQMKEQFKQLDFLKEGRKFENEVTGYLRDLYRFHKLFPKRNEFFDPFSTPIDFSAIPVLNEVFGTDDLIRPVAEFYFKGGYYREALPLMQHLAISTPDIPHVWEKIGFCLEKTTDDNDSAIEAYMKAQLFNPDSRWISRRLGICYRKKGDFRNALEYMRMSMPSDGSYDRNISSLLADTLMESGKWEEALAEFYRMDYETPGETTTLRRMAKCEMMMRDFRKAASRLETITSIDLTEEDFRMLGHIALLEGNTQEAMAQYRRTVRPNDDKRLWKSNIMSDADMLVNLGASAEDLRLLMEALAYSIE